MNPLAIFLLPAVIVAVWLFLSFSGENREVFKEQQQYQRVDEARFERDFSKAWSNDSASRDAELRLQNEEKRLSAIQEERDKREAEAKAEQQRMKSEINKAFSLDQPQKEQIK